MRTVTALLATTLLGGGLLGGCAKDLKPTGPVISPYERAKAFSGTGFSKATYLGQPNTTAPVLPFMGFGAAFDLDIALGLKSDDWDMIEVARLQIPDDKLGSRPQWLVLESREGSKEQFIISNLEEIQTWMPEIPMGRKGGAQALRVEDRTTADGIDLNVTYTNVDNQDVELILQGEPPEKTSVKRNGNTMGHSANSLLAVLDVSSTNSLFKAEAKIAGQRVRTRKIGGIVPFQFALTQTQGGIATGEYFQEITGSVPFSEGAESMAGVMWDAPAPPPSAPTIPEPANPADGEEVMLTSIDKWASIDAKKAKKAIEGQEAQIDGCLTAAVAADEDYKGLVIADFYVQGGKAYQITIDEMSTGNELAMQCVQQIVQGWTFDEALDGGIRVELGSFPFGHEAKNDAEAAWLEKNPPEAPPEEELPEEELPEEGDELEDLLGDEEPEAVAGETMLSNFKTIHTMASGQKVAQQWDIRRSGGRVYVEQDSGARTLSYEFLVHGDALELRSIQVEQWGVPNPTFAVTFSPALPDMSRPFSGKLESDFVMDVGGQASHATGKVEVSYSGSTVKAMVLPSEPSWAEDRPVTSEIFFKDGQPYVTTRRSN